jgi:polygalacturonase
MQFDRRTFLAGTGALLSTTLTAGLGCAQASPADTTLANARRVSVRQFDAAGDGRTDDTAAINRAIAACSPGEALYFPAGRYRVSVSDGVERSLLPLPIGVHVLMEPEAWILPSTADEVISVFIPLGNNVLQVNVDGQSLPASARVEDEAWRNSAHGIRAYARPDYGLGARGVTVLNSRFRNLRHAIQTEGAQQWRIADCEFERTMWSAVLLGYRDGADCLNMLVENCRFQELGDTAVALYEISGNRRGQGAWLTIRGNRARDYCLRTAGFAFDVEEGNADRQHHVVMTDNVAEHSRTGLPHFVGGFTMGYVANGEMRDNVAIGAGNSNADVGFNMLGCRDGIITGNRAENWRGAGINTDGSSNVQVTDNDVIDCGGTNANAPSIRLALAFSTRGITVSNNRVLVRAGYRHVGPGAIGIGAITGTGRSVRGIRITDNVITAPLDIGIAVYGTDSSPARDITVSENRIVGGTPGLFGSFAVHLVRSADGAVARNIVENGRFGIAVQHSRSIAVEANRFTGSTPMEVGFEVGNSSGLIIRNNGASVPVRTPLGSGDGTIIFQGNDLDASPPR